MLSGSLWISERLDVEPDFSSRKSGLAPAAWKQERVTVTLRSPPKNPASFKAHSTNERPEKRQSDGPHHSGRILADSNWLDNTPPGISSWAGLCDRRLQLVKAFKALRIA